MFLILFNDANYNASEIIAVGSPEKGFIQGFDRVFPEFRKTRLGFRCKNRFFELYFSFSKAPLFLADSMLSPVIFLEESTGFYLNYVGFKLSCFHCFGQCSEPFYLNYVGFKPA